MKQTELLKTTNPQDILKAISLIRSGEIVAVPTETVYGLAADAMNDEAIKKIFIAKGRPPTHPLIVHISSFEQLSKWAKHIPLSANLLAKHFWPGPLTMLFKKKDSVHNSLTANLDSVAIRIPNNPALLDIIDALGSGLAAPSANPHTKISPTTAQHVMDNLYGKISAVLDGGACGIGIESTILDLTRPTITILRKGPITKEMIEEVLGHQIHMPNQHLENVPGNMKKHYQPYTKTKLMSANQILDYIDLPENKMKYFAFMYYSSILVLESHNNAVKVPSNKGDYAKVMYYTLHKLDGLGVDEILIETPPILKEWGDILDRLYKASY